MGIYVVCRSLSLAAKVAFSEYARVQVLIRRVRCAIPMTAVVAAGDRWRAAGRVIQVGMRLARRCRALAASLRRGLWMHGGTSWRRLYACSPALATTLGSSAVRIR